MLNKNVTRYIDFALCTLLIPVIVLLLPVDRWLESDPIYVTLLFVWVYTIYILNRTLIVPLMFGRRRRIVVALGVFIVALGVTYLLTQYKIYSPYHHTIRMMMGEADGPHIPPRGNRLQQQAIWFLYLVITSLSVVVTLLAELNRQIIARQSVEFEKKRAELSLYKAQINPHFLFNTLNTILGLVVIKSDKAEDAIVQFTSLMRYMCSSSTEDQVTLHTEIEYIEEYIALQRHRLSEHTEVRLTNSINDSNCGYLIAPMLLITFVENALKYGASSQFASVIEINIAVVEGVLTLATKNPIFTNHTSHNHKSGIGIMNCRKRLELLYPDRYSLRIVEGSDSFEANLTIKL